MIFEKIIFWSDIKEIIRLNQEAALGNPEPEKLEKVYRIVVLELLGLIACPLALLTLLGKLGIFRS